MGSCKSHKLNERSFLLAVVRNPDGVLQKKSQMFGVFFPLPFILDVSVSGVYLPFSQAEDKEVFMQ